MSKGKSSRASLIHAIGNAEEGVNDVKSKTISKSNPSPTGTATDYTANTLSFDTDDTEPSHLENKIEE